MKHLSHCTPAMEVPARQITKSRGKSPLRFHRAGLNRRRGTRALFSLSGIFQSAAVYENGGVFSGRMSD